MTAIAVHVWLWWWRIKSRLLLDWFRLRMVLSLLWTFGPGYVFALALGPSALSRWADVRSEALEQLSRDFRRACEEHLGVGAQMLEERDGR